MVVLADRPGGRRAVVAAGSKEVHRVVAIGPVLHPEDLAVEAVGVLGT
jgi:hypothetical protein